MVRVGADMSHIRELHNCQLFLRFEELVLCFLGAFSWLGLMSRPIHLNTDLAPLGSSSQATSSGAGQRDYSVDTGTCESSENAGREGEGERG